MHWNFFSQRVTSHWNKLSEKVVQEETVNTFKNRLDNEYLYLFNSQRIWLFGV